MVDAVVARTTAANMAAPARIGFSDIPSTSLPSGPTIPAIGLRRGIGNQHEHTPDRTLSRWRMLRQVIGCEKGSPPLTMDAPRHASHGPASVGHERRRGRLAARDHAPVEGAADNRWRTPRFNGRACVDEAPRMARI